MKLGLHVAIGTGYDKAVAYAMDLGCEAIQFFHGNPRSYRPAKIDAPALERFRDARIAAKIDPAVIHTSYLINLATDDPKIAAGSLRLLTHDLAGAAAGGVRYVNTHLGSYGDRDREAGFAAVVLALETALEQIRPGVALVLENSAGAGKLCGGTIEELGRFLDAVGHPQLGVCLDTAHSWAAGYDISTRDGVERFLELVDAHVRLDRLHLFHFNDTQIALGGHRDRHWHLGEGLIGFEGFRALLSHAALRDKAAILETPGEESDDRRNLGTIRAILAGAAA